MLQKRRERKSVRQQIQRNEATKRIERFKKVVMEGPYYVCVVCNRCLYRRSVVVFKEECYENVSHKIIASRVESFDGCDYICKTCHLKLRQTEAIALFCCVASAMWACYLVRREEASSCHGFSECT